MVEEKGIRAKLIFTIDEDAMRQMSDEFTRRMDALSGGKYSSIPEEQSVDKEPDAPSGEEPGILGKILGAVMGSTKELLKISALAALVYSSVKAIMDAPMMKMFFAQFTQAFNLFFMPFGNFLGMFLMPLSIALMETAVKFNMWVGEGGLIYGMRMLLREFLIWLGELIIFDIVGPILKVLASLFQEMWDTLKEMGGMLVGAFQSGWELLVSAANIVVQWLSDIYDWVVETGKELWEDIKTTIGTAVTVLGNTYKWFTEDFPSIISNAFQTAVDWLWGKISEMMGWGSDIVDDAKGLPQTFGGGNAGRIARWAAETGLFGNTSTSTNMSSNLASTTNNITVDLKGAVVSGVTDLETVVMGAVDRALTLNVW